VAGDPFELELAVAAADFPQAATLGALDELLARDLVRPTEVARRFGFRHPLLRRAVYEATPGGWRLGAHERAANALRARGALPGTRAHHVEQSARVGRPRCDRAAQSGRFGRGGARAGMCRALVHGRTATTARGRPTPATHQAARPLARSLAAIGRLQDSRSTLLALLELLPATATTLRVKLICACATREHLLGRHTDAHDRLQCALAKLSDRSSPEAMTLMIALAIDAVYNSDYEAARDWAKHALAGATSLGERPPLAGATAIAALACTFAGDVAEGQAHTDHAAQLVDRLTDAELAMRLDAPTHLAWAECYLERYEDSIGHCERAIALSRATGQGALRPLMIHHHSASTLLLGNVPEAIDSAERIVEATRLAANPQSLIWALMNYAHVTICRDAQSALQAAEESVALSQGLEDNSIFVIPGRCAPWYWANSATRHGAPPGCSTAVAGLSWP
jgi:tetratricopeptide (TPR) repeat protein